MTSEMISSFYNCALIGDQNFAVSDRFTVMQDELLLDGQLPDNKFKFKKEKVAYRCNWIIQSDWASEKPTLLIPIRDNKDLIDTTIKNLQDTNLTRHCNVIIIDDRSTEDIKSSAIENNLSYLRVDNAKGFNFSMLNNIAAKICYDLENKTIVLWNSDLWCPKEEWFLSLLKKHKESESWVSGTKLVYPPEELSLNGEVDTKNIESTFPQKKNGAWRNTVQFGGAYWHATAPPIFLFPIHHKRFTNINDPIINCDKPIDFMTGAFHIWDLEKYVRLGGLNPTLARAYQDVDISLRSTKMGHPPMYFGKDIYLYHDESYNQHNNKNEKKMNMQAAGDHVIFYKIWGDEIVQLVVGESTA